MSLDATRLREQLPSTVVRASAGAGKTYNLTGRYLALVLRGVMTRTILATTFTRNAAHEITARLITTLADAAIDQVEASDLADRVGLSSAGFDEAAANQLDQWTQRLDDLRIQTLDAFFAQIAFGFGPELGLPPTWGIVSTTDDEAIVELALRRTLSKDPAQALHLVRMLQPGDLPRSVLGQARQVILDSHAQFKAAPTRKLWEQVPRPPMPSDATVQQWTVALRDAPLPLTAKGAPNRTASKAVTKLAEKIEQGLFQDVASATLLTCIESDPAVFAKQELSEELVDALHAIRTGVAAILLNRLADQTIATYELLERFDDAVTEVRRERRAYRFDDIAERIAGAAVLGQLDDLYFRLDGVIDHVLFDEFQDTTPLQFGILEPIAQELTSAEGRTFYAVGDAKQSIYGWRGSAPELLGTLEHQLNAVETAWLPDSYRSSPAILDFVNALFEPEPFLVAFPTAGTAIDTWFSEFRKHSAGGRNANLGGRVTWELSEANGAADTDSLVRAADFVKARVDEDPHCSIAILVRKNACVSRLIAELIARKVPASEEGGNPLTDASAVQAVVALLRLADQPSDQVAAFVVGHSPLVDIAGMRARRPDESELDWRMRGAGRRAREFWVDVVERGAPVSIAACVEQLKPSASERQARRLDQLVELVERWEASGQRFDRPIRLARAIEIEKVDDPTTNPVRVMTVHASKGLQFDTVVLPELNFLWARHHHGIDLERESLLDPPISAVVRRGKDIRALDSSGRLERIVEQEDGRQISEAMSLLYVAITRTVRELHIITPVKSRSKTAARVLDEVFATERPNEAGDRVVLFEAPDVDAEDGFPEDEHAENARARDGETGTGPSTDRSSSKRSIPDRSGTEPLTSYVQRWLEPSRGSRERRLRARRRMDDGSIVRPSSIDAMQTPMQNLLVPRDGRALSYGDLVHRYFERIEWLTNGEDWPSPAPPLPDTAPFRQLFDESTTRRQLSKIAGAEVDRVFVETELPLAIRRSGGWLRPTIDRLIVGEIGGECVSALIIDFKTDRDAGELSRDDLRQRHRAQLETYRTAVALAFEIGAERVLAAIAATANGSVVDLNPA